MRLQHHTKKLRKLGIAESGRNIFLREEHTNWLYGTIKWSTLKASIQVTLYILSRLYLYI